jgi:hypothetical protein
LIERFLAVTHGLELGGGGVEPKLATLAVEGRGGFATRRTDTRAIEGHFCLGDGWNAAGA